MRATAKDLRFHVKQILESTMGGEEVIITYRGKPAAKIVPFSDERQDSRQEDADSLFGIWKDHNQNEKVDDYIRKMRKGRMF